jgi:phosphatidylglycerophosphate synthase
MSASGARRVPTRDEYFTAWAELHGGYDPRSSFLPRIWLSFAYLCAKPFVRAGISPNAVTVLGLVVSALTLWPAAVGGRWALLVPLIVALSGLVDNLDGAVAVMSGRTSAWGYVLDSVVDRVSDGLYLVVLWLLGAPAWACVLGGALMVLQEYARARAVAGGMSEIGVVTVWERPTRVIVTVMFVFGAGLYPSAATTWVTLGALAWVGLGVVGLLQLLVVVHRRLSSTE